MNTRKTVRLALLVAAGLTLFVFESSIPKPLPWLRLGLANVATLLALYLFGVKEALIVASLRALLGSVIVGGLFSPSFLFSFLGGLFSAGLMAFVYTYLDEIFSVIGVSIWGALAHNVTQLALAMAIFVHRWEMLYLMPLFLVSTVVTGFLTGFVVFLLLLKFSQRDGSYGSFFGDVNRVVSFW